MAKKVTPQAPAAKPVAAPPADPGVFLTNSQLLTLTAALAGLYFLYSRAATGFYQQDEAAHFLSMRGFWHDANSVLGNWAKPGYKLIFALPALLGSPFVAFCNAVVAAFTCFFAYKIAVLLKSKLPLLAFAATATQPLWVNLSFRNYSEIVSALLLALATWLHLRQKTVWAALAMSYITFIRQEMYPIVGLYFLLLVWRRQFVPALLLGVFPLLQNLWGGLVTGDVLYLPHQILNFSDEIKDAFPRQGFAHYFRMSITIFGSAVVTLFVVYVSARLLEKIKKVPDSEQDTQAYLVLVPSVLYFLMYCIFNSKTLAVGPSGGGNLRYLLLISPLMGVMAALAVEKFRASLAKNWILGVVAVYLLVVGVFLTYTNNLIFLSNDQRDWIPLIGSLLTVGVLVFPLKNQQYASTFGGLMLFLVLMSVRPLKLSPEDRTCQILAYWYEEFEKANGEPPLYLHHDMFYYFLGRTRYEFKARPQAINDKNMQAAPKGSIIFWDSHYSYRPKLRKESLTHEYFLNQKEKYKVLEELMSDDGSFGVLVIEKQ
jgi:hypothetical protein